jgi:phosphate acyltransferase
MPITCIALDALGGDAAPDMVLHSIPLILKKYPDIHLQVHGSSYTESGCVPYRTLDPRQQRVTHILTSHGIAMHEKPTRSLLYSKKRSSMHSALDAVAAGTAHAAVSAGNTGILMALSQIIVRRMGSVKRPPIAALWPGTGGYTIVLDLGGSPSADAAQLLEYALLGTALFFANGESRVPRVGILNIGTEEGKGTDQLQLAHSLLQQPGQPFEYTGFVEPYGIMHNAADIVVTDGFSGNIALKSSEATAKLMREYLDAAYRKNFFSKVLGLISKPVFKEVRARMNPGVYNGGVFLGLNGIVVKAHGSSTPDSYSSAVGRAVELHKNNLTGKISDYMQTL